MTNNEHAFEVRVSVGPGTVTTLRGASFATAVARAQHDANTHNKTVIVRNTASGEETLVHPRPKVAKDN